MNNSTNLLIQQALLAAEAKKKEVESVVPEQKFAPKLEEGIYIAVVIDAKFEQNLPTDFGGISHRVSLTFSVPILEKSVEITSRYWVSKSEDSRYVSHLKELLGEDPRVGFELSQLIGQVVEMEIHHFKNDKGTFASVSNIQRIEKSQFENNITI